MRILLKNDYLEIKVRELNVLMESTDIKFEATKKAHKNVVESLSKIHLMNEYQETIDTMRDDLKNSNNVRFSVS